MKLPIQIAAPILLLAACGQPSAEQQARRDAAAVAQVNAAQNQLPPLQPIRLEPLGPDDMARIDAQGVGCAFYPTGAAGAPVMVNDRSLAWVKRDAGIVKLASDPGSAQSPGGTWSRYVGREFTLRTEAESGPGAPAGEEGASWPAELTLRDPHDRVALRQRGRLVCGA